MAETTYYIVGKDLKRQDDGSIVAEKTSLTTDLSALHKENDLFISSLDEWTEKVLKSSDLQAALKINLSVANEEELKAYGPKLEIFAAVDKVRGAKPKAEQEELEGKTVAVKYFSKAITTREEATEFLSEYGFAGAYQFSFWVEAIMKANTQWEFSPEAAQALADAWLKSAGTDTTKKATVTKSEQYKKVQGWAK